MKVLILGYNPPPLQPQSKLEAANYRTWQFLQPLLEDGHSVCLCVEASSPRPAPGSVSDGLRWEAIAFDRLGWARHLQIIHDDFSPDCILAVDFYPSLWVTKLRTLKPIWMDLYGDPLTIMQVGSYRVGSDQGIATHIALARLLLRRGDAFSTCGVPQQHMLVGELAMSGRLNSRTLGYDFVRPIYPGAPPTASERLASDPGHASLASYGIGADSFVVLWCGGYNTWTDVDTLFRGIEGAMASEERVHFVSVGASTYQAPETVYDRFVAQVQRSDYAARYHLLGWRPWQDIPELYRASDMGLSIDALHYETIYGTRTRLVEMLAYGLPVITSKGCEIGDLVLEKQVGLNFASGDWRGLADAIVSLAHAPSRVARLREEAGRLVTGEWSFGATTAPFREWVKDPHIAPDRTPPSWTGRAHAVKFNLRTTARLTLWMLGLLRQGRRTGIAHTHGGK